MFPEFSCNDIIEGIHYLVKEQIIFKEYRFICVDILSRGILDNMFSIFMQDDFADFAFDSNDNDIDDLCSELETDLHTLRSQQAFYHRRLSGSLLDPILEVDEEEDVENVDDKKKEKKRLVELVYDMNDEREDDLVDDADDENDESDEGNASDLDDIFKPST